MATIATLANNVLAEINLPSQSSYIGSSNRTAVQAVALANRAGRFLATKDWRILSKRHTITTVSSVEAYGLPSDFDRFVDRTQWNDSNDEIMQGPLSDERWQADVTGLVTVMVNDRFQVRADGNGNRLFIRPVPTSAESVTFFYKSDAWCISKGGQRQKKWEADTDEVLFPEDIFELELKWRLLQAQRRDFQVELAEARSELNKAIARDGGMKAYRILGPIETEQPPHGRIPETGFGT